MAEKKPALEMPYPLVKKLREVQGRHRAMGVAAGLVAGAVVLAAAMCVAMFVDWLAVLYDSPLRMMLTVAALVAAAAAAVGWIMVVRRRSQSLGASARIVDDAMPQLEERWSTIAQVANSPHTDDAVHPAMFRHVAAEAVGAVKRVEARQVVDRTPLRRNTLALSGVAAVLLLTALIDWQETSVLFRRFWAPGASISATRLVDAPERIVVGRGEPVTLAAHIEGRPVKRALLMMRTDDGAPVEEFSLTPSGQNPQSVSHRLRAAQESQEYRLRAGDGQTEWGQLVVAERPEIGEVRMTLTPPEYTHESPKVYERLIPRLSGMAGSQFEVAIRPKHEIDRAELRITDKKALPLTKDKDGWYVWRTELADSFDFLPALVESHGLENRRPPSCRVEVYPDQAPVVRVVTPDDQAAVLPNDEIEITFEAQDDVGVGAAELLVYGDPAEEGAEPQPLARIPIDLGKQQGQKRVEGAASLDLSQFQAADQAILSYEIHVSETRGKAMAPAPVDETKTPNGTLALDPKQPADSSAQIAAAPMDEVKTPSGEQSLAPQQPSASEVSRDAQTAERSAEPSQDAALPSPAAEKSLAATEPSGTRPSPSAAADKASKMASAADSEASRNAAAKAASAESPVSRDAKSAERSADSSSNAAPPTATASNDPMKKQTPSDTPGAMPSETPAPMAGAQASASPQSYSSGEKSDGKSNSEAKTANGSQTASASPGGDSKSPMKGDEKERTAASERRTLRPATGDESKEDEETPQDKPQSSQMAKSEPQKQPPMQPDPGKHPDSEQLSMAQAKDAADAAKKQPSKSQPKDPQDPQQQNGGAQQNSSSMASSGKPQESGDPGQQPPGDNMTRRTLDVPAATAASQRMRLKIDKYAGSFDGQRRAKLELAIGGRLAEIDKLLADAETRLRSILDDLATPLPWEVRHDRQVDAASKSLDAVHDIVADLEHRSKNTPYAFIGLQLVDIHEAHVAPARDDLWQTLQRDEARRQPPTASAWEHVVRARELLADLTSTFQRAKREQALADKMQEVKTMYRIFVEDAFAALGLDPDDSSAHQRKMAEFDLDEEYLARLKEVLEMQRKLRSELAKILAEDPRLLRRFMDSFRNKSASLYSQVTDLKERQEMLSDDVEELRKVRAEGQAPPRLGVHDQLVEDAGAMAVAAAQLKDKFDTWAPLKENMTNNGLMDAGQALDRATTAARELEKATARYAAQPKVIVADDAAKPAEAGDESADDDATAADQTASKPAGKTPEQLADEMHEREDRVIDAAEDYRSAVVAAQTAMVRAQAAGGSPDMAAFLLTRIGESRKASAALDEWNDQFTALVDDKPQLAAEITQMRLARQTDELAGKLGTVEQQLAAMLQSPDGLLPKPIADKARALLATLDKKAVPAQSASAFALRKDDFTAAAPRASQAVDALGQAEKDIDDLFTAAIKELDKLPVQDPIAQLLEDPTLDELLAQLEQEQTLRDALGIPDRPSNLQIMGDFTKPGGGGGIAMGMSRGQLMQQMMMQQQRISRAADRARRAARLRAEREGHNMVKIRKPTGSQKPPAERWNTLLSELEDGLLQGRGKLPPERYRPAIEQYFDMINRGETEQQ